MVCLGSLKSQTGDIRGFVYNSESGERIANALVKSASDGRIVLTDADGYYSLTKLTLGKQRLWVWAAGFDTISAEVMVFNGANTKADHYLQKTTAMEEVRISVARKRDAGITGTPIEPKQIYKIPTVGAEADIIQYLQIMPGVVFTGDQGGQLYIRGGSPIMNKVMLDGMTIYNPFHSIGLFSVFETDLIKSADVHTAGFGAQYGGRISAVVDVRTRDGNKQKLSAKTGLTTFTGKFLLEGPIKKFSKGNSNSSFVLSYRN
ncbi:MAG: TonB-dependent receptor, partial [Bacteroidetes bacterium]|nr:TonB-dependent receptor [Bacteroidota bacterium]